MASAIGPERIMEYIIRQKQHSRINY